MYRRKRSHFSRGILILIVVALILGVFSVFRNGRQKGSDAVNAPIGSNSGSIALVYFLDNNNPATTTSCGITRAVVRSIGKTTDPYGATLKALFAGPTSQEKNESLTTAFAPSADQKDLKPLSSYYKSVSIQDSIAYVDFTPEALTYLNSPACMQEAVKRPIENTLKQFPDIDQVEYSINGNVFREWDA